MHRQGRPPDEILESVLDDISAEKADWPLAVGGRRRWRPQAPGVQAVREGAFMEWIETHGPEPKRYHSRVSCASDDDTSKQIAPAASLHCSGTKPHQRRVQFRVSSTTEALISSDNSEIHLFMKDAGDRPIGTANTSGTLTLRFRVFSMGRKSIRRLMRDAAGNRSGVQALWHCVC
ncbi:hypothetical protein F1559_000937 [Cyanidiococcus yangmingshanensis]|uniref:Uncharacterized protein n=1 Tax=Cyanidiococcus yangmingshanensis TaxID=2690220 RepID=A0A7J7IGS8_9RHOD|nr:hypothetical protein F1559_000937 [Cyanidiococcus yangmingshanensis]